jgi:hypothetical protein
MIQQITQENVWNVRNRASLFCVIVSATRAPAVRSIYVDLSTDVAVSYPTPGHDGDWVPFVIDAVEVPVDL